MAHRIGLLLAAVGMSCGLGLACGGAGTTNKDASGGGGSPAGVGGSSGRGGGGLGSAGTGASAGGTATGGGGSGAGGVSGGSGAGGVSGASGAGGVSGASGAAGDAGAAGGAGASGNGARGGGAGDAVGGTAGTIGGGGGATGNAGGRGGAAGSNGGRGGAAGNAGGGSGGSSGAGGSTGGGGRGGSAGTAGAAGAGAGSGGRGGGTAGAGGGGGQLAPPCAQTIIDLPGSAFSPPTLVPTNAGLHVVWMNADDNHRLQGGRIVGGAFTGGWTSTFAVSNATVPAAWNGTDLALTYSTRGDNNTVNLMTVAADGSISSGPFLLPGNPGLPVAIAWNGNEYGVASSDLTTVTFMRVGPDGQIRASRVLDGFRSPPTVQWDGTAWLIASAMIWTINEPARFDVMRLAPDGSVSLGKQSASTAGATRGAQVTEMGGSIFAAFGNHFDVQFGRFDVALANPPFVVPLPRPGQVGAIGIAARGSTLGIAMITFPSAIGLVTHFLEVDQMGQPVRTTQILGSSSTGNLGSPPVSIVATSSGWAIGWEDFASGFFDGRVSFLDCD